MAENKKSFVLYTDQRHVFDALDDDEAGRLIKHLFAYVCDENPTPADKLTKIAFEPIMRQLKRDLEKYEGKRTQWREAGKASAEAKRLAKLTDVEQKPTVLTDVANRSTVSTVNATVNDNVNVTVNVNEDSSTPATAKIDHETFLRNLFAENETAQAHREALHLAARVAVTKDHARKFNASLLTESKHHAEEREWRKHFRNWLSKGGHAVGYEGKDGATDFNFKLITKKQ